jgi:Reverse transcriptase (RNA-dependent DNA polymerase)
MVDGPLSLDSPRDIVNAFSEHFKLNMLNDSDCSIKLKPMCEVTPPSNPPVYITNPQQIKSLILKLKEGKSSGGDPLPVNVLKCVAEEISAPLSMLYNKCFRLGQFPARWKRALVTPVHKKGPKSHVKNYRPISILPVFSKLFEGMLYNVLFSEAGALLPESQHGFMPLRSTVSNLLEYTHRLASNIKNKLQTDSVYIDFCKAFDRVPHTLLLTKLRKLGINPCMVKLINNYLVHRTQVVVLDNVRSCPVNVASGVVQGSKLGPLLFNLYVCDLPSTLSSSHCSMYADDSKIFMPVQSAVDCESLQDDLDNLFDWCLSWCMELNLDKCQVLSITNKRTPLLHPYNIGGHVLERVRGVVDLGVSFTSDLSFNPHLDLACNKASRMLGFMKRSCRNFSADTFRRMYVALVRPLLEYACPVWSPHHVTKIDRVERIQRSFLRTWCHKSRVPYTADYASVCKAAGVFPLQSRREALDLLYLHKTLHSQVNSSYLLGTVCLHAPVRVTRAPQIFKPPHARIDVFKHHFCQRAQEAYNAISSNPDHTEFDIFDMSFSQYRHYLYGNVFA